MPSKRVLIAGATGVVGYAALKHFGSQKDCEVIASRVASRTRFSARDGIRSAITLGHKIGESGMFDKPPMP